MSEFTKSKCLYLCESHLAIALKKIEFGRAIDSIRPVSDSPCQFCNYTNAVVRLFVFTEHWLVAEYLKENVIEA